MTKLRELSYQQVVHRLSYHGFRFYRQGKGSHELWVRDADGRVIPVPHHGSKAIKKGTVRAIIREVGVSVDELHGFEKLIYFLEDINIPHPLQDHPKRGRTCARIFTPNRQTVLEYL